MTVKFTYNEDKETFGFKGLDAEHLISIMKLLANTRSGTGPLSKAVADIIWAYENSKYGGDLDYLIADARLSVTYDLTEGKIYAPVMVDTKGEVVAPSFTLTEQ